MLYLGLSQWNYSFFKGTLYPEKTKSANHLQYYAAKFNTVELNSTFYEIPEDNKLLHWKSLVSSGFKFCPKVSSLISHEKYLRNIEQPVDNFINSVKLLDENLGISYLQLAPSMFAANVNLLDEFLSYVNNRIKVSIELRPDWLGRTNVLKQCLEILKKHNAGIVMVDGAETVQYLNALKLTNRTAFIRFLSYDHQTDFARIDDWVKVIKFWQDKGLNEIYFILHCADKPYEPAVIAYTIERFEKELGFDLGVS